MESFPYAVYVYPASGLGKKLIGPTCDFAKAFDCYTKAAQSGEHVVLFDQLHQGGFSPRFEANKTLWIHAMASASEMIYRETKKYALSLGYTMEESEDVAKVILDRYKKNQFFKATDFLIDAKKYAKAQYGYKK